MKKAPELNSAVAERDQEAELPEGWSRASLGECVDILDHLRIPVNSDERVKRQGKVPYYGATGQVGWIDDYLFDEELVLLGEDGAPFLDKDKPIAYLISGKSWVNNHAHVLRAIAGLTSNAYIKHVLDVHDFFEEVTGSTRLKLTQGAMRAIPVPLSPVTEQARIVSIVQKLVAELDKCRARLTKVPTILKAFRQSVLAAACSGRLTEDWREKESGGYDPTELPAGWRRATVGEVIVGLKYGTAQKCSYEKRGVPVFRIPNIEEGVISHSDLKYAQLPAKELQQLRLCPGDILLIRSNGSVSLVGKSALVRELERDCAYAGYLIRLRPALAQVMPEFLNLSLGSYQVRLQIEMPARSTSGVHNINGEEVRALPLSLPPIPEQHEIVRRVEALFKLADKIEKRVEAATKRADKLTQSILAKAFRGELVPTEAELARQEGRTYESASELLAHIRSERAKSAATKTTAANRKCRPVPAGKRP
jgi:type I restriction enzyme, S subunit